MNCFFCKGNIQSNDSELLSHPGKCWRQVSVCKNCIRKLPKWKQELYYKEKWKNYTQQWDVYLRKVKLGEKIHIFKYRKDL